MKKIFFLVVFIFSFLFSVSAQDVSRFFAGSSIENHGASNLTFEQLPIITHKDVSVEEHNHCAELNNQAIESIRNRDYIKGERLLAEACIIMPDEKLFWNNRLIALSNISGREEDTINAGRVMMVLDSNNYVYPYNIGIIYLNNLNNPRLAAAYLKYAYSKSSDKPEIIRALISALDKVGGCEGDIFSLLKDNAHKDNTGYLSYLLGLNYLERKDFNPAIRALDSARQRDAKGYAHYAWIRAKFCAGQLDGLAKEIKYVLQRFPNDSGASTAKRFLKSLTKQDYKFDEYINIKLKNASKFDSMDVFYKEIPNIEGHQQVEIISAEVISKGKVYNVSVEPSKKAGVKKIILDKHMLGTDLRVKVTNRIKIQPTIDACYDGNTNGYEVTEYNNDKLLCLNNKYLTALFNRIKKQEGGFVPNAVLAVVRGLEYKENGYEYSVDWIFDNPNICDCSEFSLLMTALCIKNKMPSRLVHGFLIKSDNINVETSIGHAWCEIYSKGNGWVPVDATASKGVDWAYCGHLLSDQIVFGYKNGEKNDSRVTLSYTALKNADIDIEMSASYKISKWGK